MTDRQRGLFDESEPSWEVDARRDVLLARVVFVEGVDGVFDYRVPDGLRGVVAPGKRLHVPLGKGNRLTLAFCVDVKSESSNPARYKQVHSVLDETELLSARLLELTQWMADYYVCRWGRVLQSVIPAGVRGKAGTRVVTLYSTMPGATSFEESSLTSQQRLIMRAVAPTGGLSLNQIRAKVGCSDSPVRTLVKRGYLRSRRERIASDLSEAPATVETADVVLNDAQQSAVSSVVGALRRGQSETFVLHGVTGSGKTEVYIRAIEEVIAFGRQAIVLVPEISLTPQTQRRFRARFPQVAVLHSLLSDAERSRHWQRIASGQSQVVVGARSAVFAPTRHLGLIILDEEHDASFKQDQLPRYHAREVAKHRAQVEGIPLLLGSATPSLESWHWAQTGQATLLSMPNRVLNLPLPDVVLIDQSVEFRQRRSFGPMSRRLEQAVRSALRRQEQVILLLNRRGHSTHIQCPACGHVVRCPDCELSLTHHVDGNKAVCHYCDYTIAPPPECPECAFEGIRYRGTGTQKLEQEVRRVFSSASVLRMDSDTMRRPGSHEASLQRFRDGEVQILVGTQMIAKGLDFPNVTVVGVINADTALHLPDFRAAERTFQLVTQVAGRTGRGQRGGRVYVQTLNPEHPAVRAAERHDYLAFAKQELPTRAAFNFPPYGELLRVIVRAEQESLADLTAQKIAAELRRHEHELAHFRLLGPAPAPIAKTRANYRYHLLAQAATLTPLKATLERLQREEKFPDGVQWVVDIDPLDML